MNNELVPSIIVKQVRKYFKASLKSVMLMFVLWQCPKMFDKIAERTRHAALNDDLLNGDFDDYSPTHSLRASPIHVPLNRHLKYSRYTSKYKVLDGIERLGWNGAHTQCRKADIITRRQHHTSLSQMQLFPCHLHIQYTQ